MVSKTWYLYLERERNLWIKQMEKCFEDVRKKSPIGHLQDWVRLSAFIAQNGDNSADMITLTRSLNSIISSDVKVYVYKPALSLGMGLIPEELTFLKMLTKYDFLDGLEQLSEALELVCWSLQNLKA